MPFEGLPEGVMSRIFIIDDCPEFCRKLCEAFERKGFDTEFAESKNAFLSNQLPKLDSKVAAVVIDVRLDTLNRGGDGSIEAGAYVGKEVYRILRKKSPHVYVFFLSAMKFDLSKLTIDSLQQDRNVAFILKPQDDFVDWGTAKIAEEIEFAIQTKFRSQRKILRRLPKSVLQMLFVLWRPIESIFRYF